jgi:outer membrane lipase/esterase
MKNVMKALGALSLAALLAACGGGGAGDQTTKANFTGFVNFGDSLSDVGTYKVGTVAALGGGKYTVNGPNALNWTEVVANTYKLPAPCAAQTGLDGAAAQGFSVPVINVATCFNYAQGGSRVTSQPGPGNKLLGGTNAILGQLTVPVKDQMTAHLTKVNGAYTGKELVTVMAGGNDVFFNSGLVSAGAATPQQAVVAMGTAGAELAGYVKALVLGKGAKTVVVVNLPNVAVTPLGLASGAQGQALITAMVNAFNDQLKKGLDGTGVVLADAYTESTTQASNPAPYGLSNVTGRACSTTNALGGTSLVCNATNLNSGDVSRYQYADDVHPTPYGHELLAKFVLSEMLKAGLL